MFKIIYSTNFPTRLLNASNVNRSISTSLMVMHKEGGGDEKSTADRKEKHAKKLREKTPIGKGS